MTAFRVQRLRGAETIGERLRRVREEQSLSLAEAARRSQVAEKYLQAIEESRYADLPGAVYARNFLRQYARVLVVRERPVVEAYEREVELVQSNRPVVPVPGADLHQPHPILTPRGIRRAAIVVLAAAVLVYLGSEVRNLTAAPKLTLFRPADQTTTSERSIQLAGTTDPETTVTINGQPVEVQRNGTFEETIDLQTGLNTVIVQAERKRGRSTTLRRTILVESSPGG